MIIAIDVDGVLADYNSELAFIVERELELHNGTLNKSVSWGFEEWPLHDKGFKHYHKMMMEERLLEMKPFDLSSEVISRLAENHTIKIVTQRASGFLNGPKLKNDIAVGTILWLQKHNIVFHELCFVEDKTSVTFDLIIEDSPLHLQSFIDAGRNYIIMDHKHNDMIMGIRFNNWLDIEKYIEGLNERN